MNNIKSIKFIEDYFKKVQIISSLIDYDNVNRLVIELSKLKKRNGRLFFLGVGGSAGNSSHAVNDFRKLCGIESYTPTDNVSELTARINDEGWDSSFVEWLKISKLNKKDSIFIFSVGGGSKEKNISVNLVKAVDYAKLKKIKIFGVIGRKQGYAKKKGDNVIVVPDVDSKMITPFSEAFQAVIWHCLVSHPMIQTKKTKW
jgi:D-sedoheptulose 7-phosphate isomerase|tara:strand:+ start:257 stop:859 length:603 start_codon:yes stop_codon:yes gene_type:complete